MMRKHTGFLAALALLVLYSRVWAESPCNYTVIVVKDRLTADLKIGWSIKSSTGDVVNNVNSLEYSSASTELKGTRPVYQREVSLEPEAAYTISLTSSTGNYWMDATLQIVDSCTHRVAASFTKASNNAAPESYEFTTGKCAPCNRCEYSIAQAVDNSKNGGGWYLYDSRNLSLVASSQDGKKNTPKSVSLVDGLNYTISLSGYQPNLLAFSIARDGRQAPLSVPPIKTIKGCTCKPEFDWGSTTYVNTCADGSIRNGTYEPSWCIVEEQSCPRGTPKPILDTDNGQVVDYWDNCTELPQMYPFSPEDTPSGDGEEYLFLTSANYTYSEAEGRCQQLGGHLAVLHDALTYSRVFEAYDFVLNASTVRGVTRPNVTFPWLGLKHPDSKAAYGNSNGFVTADGSVFDYGFFGFESSVCPSCFAGGVTSDAVYMNPDGSWDVGRQSSTTGATAICKRVRGVTFTASCPAAPAAAAATNRSQNSSISTNGTRGAVDPPVVLSNNGSSRAVGTENDGQSSGKTAVVVGAVIGAVAAVAIIAGVVAYKKGLIFQDKEQHMHSSASSYPINMPPGGYASPPSGLTSTGLPVFCTAAAMPGSNSGGISQPKLP